MPLNNAPIQQNLLLSNGRPENIWTKWFGIVSRAITYIRNDGSIEPVSLADADAANNSIYYSTDQSKLVFKDSGGVVNDLY
jgi:hypothetical protein